MSLSDRPVLIVYMSGEQRAEGHTGGWQQLLPREIDNSPRDVRWLACAHPPPIELQAAGSRQPKVEVVQRIDCDGTDMFLVLVLVDDGMRNWRVLISHIFAESVIS